MEDISKLGMADLHALYLFVKGLENKPFSMSLASNLAQNQIKTLVRQKSIIIEEELMQRTFGENIFDRLTIKGMKPEDIDLKKFEKPEGVETFIVSKPEPK